LPWSRSFDNPIVPPKGKALTTLKDAAAYIMKLPKAKQQSPEWQAATEALLMAAEKLLSAMTLDELGAKMRCKKCGKRPERYYAANQSDTPGFVRSF